jgi:hypothetical protein
VNRSLASKTGYQGTQNLITPGTAPLPAVGLGTLQALLAANFEEPDVYTVMFNLTTSSVLPVITPSQGGPQSGVILPTGSSEGVRAVAVVNLKVEGSQVQRVLDVGSGVSLSGTCQGIDVFVQDRTSTIGGAAGLQYAVSAQVTRGVRPATDLPPTLWESAGLILPGFTITIPVPQNSGINSVEVVGYDHVTPATPCSLLVVHATAGTANKFYIVNSTDTGFVKLAPNAGAVIISNVGPDATEYALTWGIDG